MAFTCAERHRNLAWPRPCTRPSSIPMSPGAPSGPRMGYGLAACQEQLRSSGRASLHLLLARHGGPAWVARQLAELRAENARLLLLLKLPRAQAVPSRHAGRRRRRACATRSPSTMAPACGRTWKPNGSCWQRPGSASTSSPARYWPTAAASACFAACAHPRSARPGCCWLATSSRGKTAPRRAPRPS